MKHLFVLVLLAAVLITTAQRFDNPFNRGGQSSSNQGTQSPFNRGSLSSFNQGNQNSFNRPNQNALNQPRQNPTKVTTEKPARPKSSVTCPEKNGRFPTRTCDSYIECDDGYGEEKTCPDGLLFNAAGSIFSYPCQYPIDVDCAGRTGTQPAQSTDDCPHQYGYYRIGGPSECGQFRNCVDGHGFVFDCPEGLAFDETTYRCNWPDLVESCNAKGFDCPAVGQGPDGRSLDDGIYTSYRSSKDCQRYFICVNGKPRLHNCGEGRAFNEIINSCDGIENVTGCSGGRSSGGSGRSDSTLQIDPRFNQNRFSKF